MEYKNCIVFLMGFTGVGKNVVAQEIVKYHNFKLVTDHLIENPVVSLLDLPALSYRIPDAAWLQVNKVRDAIFTTINELSPKHFSFVMTYDMVDGQDFPQLLFNQTKQLSIARHAYLLPVRLECSEEELIKRISSVELFKQSRFIDRAIDMVRNKKVFYSKHPNEITIDTTNKSAEQVARLILNVVEERI